MGAGRRLAATRPRGGISHILIREDADRAKLRFRARLRNAIQPAAFTDEHAQLPFFDRFAANRYRQARGLTLRDHIGFGFGRHTAILSLEESWQALAGSGFLRGDLLLARFYFNANVAGQVTEYEPFFDGGRLAGFGAKVVGTLAFPAPTGFSAERVEGVLTGEPDRVVDLRRGRWADVARLSGWRDRLPRRPDRQETQDRIPAP